MNCRLYNVIYIIKNGGTNLNKNIKKIIAVVMAIGTISAVSPVTNANVLTTKAYASTTNDETELESLKLETSSGSNIKLYSDNDYDSDNKVDSEEISDGDIVYAKTSENTVSINADGPSSKYIRVFIGTSDSTKGKKTSSDLSLSSGTNTLTVRVYNEEPDSSIRYDEDSDVASEYKIKVKCTGSGSSDDSSSSDDYDDIYLEKLSVDGTSIDLSDSKIDYSYNVASDVDEVTVKATPQDEDTDTVEIDGDEVDSSDKYKKTISLNKGDNKIKIDLTNDDDDERVYTLNIIRGGSATTSSTSTTTTATSTPDTATTVSTVSNARINQWVPVNDTWQYNDATGTPVKNTWIANHYLQDNGNMATGWLTNGGNWYYLGTDGSKKTGWIKDTDGKYYYLNSDGTMAYNTTIGGYKLVPGLRIDHNA
jgi:hypothetical protein